MNFSILICYSISSNASNFFIEYSDSLSTFVVGSIKHVLDAMSSEITKLKNEQVSLFYRFLSKFCIHSDRLLFY